MLTFDFTRGEKGLSLNGLNENIVVALDSFLELSPEIKKLERYTAPPFPPPCIVYDEDNAAIVLILLNSTYFLRKGGS